MSACSSASPSARGSGRPGARRGSRPQAQLHRHRAHSPWSLAGGGGSRINEGVAARILLDFDVDAEDPKSPPLAPEFVAELERVRANKEEALATMDFERAASLRDRERKLGRAARQLEHVWEGRPMRNNSSVTRPISHTRAVPIRTVTARVPLAAVFAGWMLFGAALGIGLVVGRLIWG